MTPFLRHSDIWTFAAVLLFSGSVLAGTGDSDPDNVDEKVYSGVACTPTDNDAEFEYVTSDLVGLLHMDGEPQTAECPVVRDDPDVCGVDYEEIYVRDERDDAKICCTAYIVDTDGTRSAAGQDCTTNAFFGTTKLDLGADNGDPDGLCDDRTQRVYVCDMPYFTAIHGYRVGERDAE